MSLLVPDGATLQCSMGLSPGTLKVLPTNQTNGSSVPLATVLDFQPMVNIQPFGMCQSPSNPQVAAATAAALGVLTPQPCVPVTTSPWSPANAGIAINKLPALLDNGTCNCSWGGTIQIQQAGQQVVGARSGSSQNSTTTPAAVQTPPSVQRPPTHHVAHQVVCGTTGKPMKGVKWQLRNSSGTLIASGTTSDDGCVSSPVPQPGQHSLEFDASSDDTGPDPDEVDPPPWRELESGTGDDDGDDGSDSSQASSGGSSPPPASGSDSTPPLSTPPPATS